MPKMQRVLYVMVFQEIMKQIIDIRTLTMTLVVYGSQVIYL